MAGLLFRTLLSLAGFSFLLLSIIGKISGNDFNNCVLLALWAIPLIVTWAILKKKAGDTDKYSSWRNFFKD